MQEPACQGCRERDARTALLEQELAEARAELRELRAEVREVKAYFEYLYELAKTCHADGMTALQAARSAALDRWADWGEPERLVVTIANIYSELDDEEPMNPLAAFEQMAQLARPL